MDKVDRAFLIFIYAATGVVMFLFIGLILPHAINNWSDIIGVCP